MTLTSFVSAMPGRNCAHCSSLFSSSSNRLRHERLFHSEMDNEKVDSETLESEDEQDEATNEQCDHHEEDDSGTDSDEEQVCSLWNEVVRAACVGSQLNNREMVLKEPFLSDFVDKMKEFVENRIQFVQSMELDEQYTKINETIDKFENDGYDREEAVDTAWHNRRFLVRRIIEHHLDTVKEMMNDDTESDASNSDDNGACALTFQK